MMSGSEFDKVGPETTDGTAAEASVRGTSVPGLAEWLAEINDEIRCIADQIAALKGKAAWLYAAKSRISTIMDANNETRRDARMANSETCP